MHRVVQLTIRAWLQKHDQMSRMHAEASNIVLGALNTTADSLIASIPLSDQEHPPPEEPKRIAWLAGVCQACNYKKLRHSGSPSPIGNASNLTETTNATEAEIKFLKKEAG